MAFYWRGCSWLTDHLFLILLLYRLSRILLSSTFAVFYHRLHNSLRVRVPWLPLYGDLAARVSDLLVHSFPQEYDSGSPSVKVLTISVLPCGGTYLYSNECHQRGPHCQPDGG